MHACAPSPAVGVRHSHPREVARESKNFDHQIAKPLGAAPFGSNVPNMGDAGRKRRLLRERIVGLFAAGSPYPELVLSAGHPGLATLDVARATVSRAIAGCDQRSPVVAEHLRTMTQCIEALGGAVGGAERVNGTPLPVVYAHTPGAPLQPQPSGAHRLEPNPDATHSGDRATDGLRHNADRSCPLAPCRRASTDFILFLFILFRRCRYVAHLQVFLLVVIATIPVVYWPSFRWFTPLLTLIVSVALLGLESSAVECERPFKRVPTMNHVNVEELAKAVSTNVTQIVRTAALCAVVLEKVDESIDRGSDPADDRETFSDNRDHSTDRLSTTECLQKRAPGLGRGTRGVAQRRGSVI